jgi:hypothetical protein
VDEGNTSITLADDLINGIFAAATLAGNMTSQGCDGTLAEGLCCSTDNLPTVGDLFPDDCDDPDFMTDNDNANAAIIGTCLGIRAGDLSPTAAEALCESYSDGLVGTRIAQATCHGVRDADCSAIPGGPLEKALCERVPPLNIKASDPLLLCGRTGIEPRFLIADEAGTPSIVESRLIMNDLLVSVVVDRARDGYQLQEVTTIPSCLEYDNGTDCRMIGICLDLVFAASMQMVQGEEGPEIDFGIADVIPQPRADGETCAGGLNLRYNYEENATEGTAESNPIAERLRDNAGDAVPVQAPENISLGGLVTFEDPEIFSIKTGTESGRCINNLETSCTSDGQCGGEECILFQDYIGVRGTIQTAIPENPDVCTERCGNERDDDGDGDIDCADVDCCVRPDCCENPVCAGHEACAD